MAADFGNLGLRCGEEWVPFPATDEMELRYWAHHTAVEIAERFALNGESSSTRGLEKNLAYWAADARTRSPLAAFGWYLNGHPSAAALLELDGIEPDDSFPELTLPLLTDKLTDAELGQPDVSNLELPLGPSVRIRQNSAGERKWPLGSRPVVRTLIYAVRPQGTDVALTMHVSWRDAVIDVPVTDAADLIAQTLEM